MFNHETHTEKSGFFVPRPSNLSSHKQELLSVPQISQEERELLKAGYSIYHISAHRDTSILVIDSLENKIIENSGDLTLKHIPKNLEELILLLSSSELSDANVTQLQLT